MFKGTHVIGTHEHRTRPEDHRTSRRSSRTRSAPSMTEAARRAAPRRDRRPPRPRGAARPSYSELEEKFDALVKEQREIMVKNEFDAVYTEGRRHRHQRVHEPRLDRSTSITVPANKLELWFWMESDRLTNPVFREFYSERDVVHEERRLRTESTPTGKFERAVRRDVLGGASRTRWPVVGWPSDLANITQGRGRRVLRALLRAEQPHRDPGRRLRSEAGDGARGEVLRPTPKRQPSRAPDVITTRDATARGEAHLRRGRDQPGRSTSAGTRCRSRTRTPRARVLARAAQRADRAGCTSARAPAAARDVARPRSTTRASTKACSSCTRSRRKARRPKSSSRRCTARSRSCRRSR